MSRVQILPGRPIYYLGVGQFGWPPGLGPGIRKVHVGSNPTVETNLTEEKYFQTIRKTQSKINVLSHGVIDIFGIDRILDGRYVVR